MNFVVVSFIGLQSQAHERAGSAVWAPQMTIQVGKLGRAGHTLTATGASSDVAGFSSSGANFSQSQPSFTHA